MGRDAQEARQAADEHLFAGQRLQRRRPYSARPRIGEAFNRFTDQGSLALSSASMNCHDTRTVIAGQILTELFQFIDASLKHAFGTRNDSGLYRRLVLYDGGSSRIVLKSTGRCLECCIE